MLYWVSSASFWVVHSCCAIAAVPSVCAIVYIVPATVPGKHCLKSCKTVCNHLSKINQRSTRIKTKFLQVECVGVVGKGLYYHRFVDVLSMGNGMKWDEKKQLEKKTNVKIIQCTQCSATGI